MTDKQIIIDGVDVSWCKYFCLNQMGNNCLNHNRGFSMNCNNNNCYYKQFKRAEHKLDKIKKVCNKFTPEYYKILLIINGGIVEE